MHDPTTDARTTDRRERKSALYMQCSCGELKDCSIWLRNLIEPQREKESGVSARTGGVSVIVLPKMSADMGERWVGTYSAGETQMPRY